MGDEPWPHNPAWTVPQDTRGVVRLWAACRGGMGGYSSWPDDGGVSDQAAWLVDAFAVLTSASAAWDEAERKRRRDG